MCVYIPPWIMTPPSRSQLNLVTDIYMYYIPNTCLPFPSIHSPLNLFPFSKQMLSTPFFFFSFFLSTSLNPQNKIKMYHAVILYILGTLHHNSRVHCIYIINYRYLWLSYCLLFIFCYFHILFIFVTRRQQHTANEKRSIWQLWCCIIDQLINHMDMYMSIYMLSCMCSLINVYIPNVKQQYKKRLKEERE